jgi:hypothetical protein
MTIDLTEDGFSGSRLTMLENGHYELRLDTTLIAATTGGALVDSDGDSDGTYRFHFQRLLGDFNGDGKVDDVDIDLLRDAILGMSSDVKFNVNGLGDPNTPDEADFTYMIEVILATAFGDSNLDHRVDCWDLGYVRRNFGMTGGWAKGNSTLDLDIDAKDLALVRNNFGFPAAPVKASEPSTAELGTDLLDERSSAVASVTSTGGDVGSEIAEPAQSSSPRRIETGADALTAEPIDLLRYQSGSGKHDVISMVSRDSRPSNVTANWPTVSEDAESLLEQILPTKAFGL